MKKIVYFFIFLATVIIILWLLRIPKQKLEFFILDKSAITVSTGDHFHLIKYLNKKYTHDNGQRYKPSVDYYGQINPTTKESLKRIDLSSIQNISESFDFFYFADTKGLNISDMSTSHPGQNIFQIYGGLSHNEYLLINEVIGEKPIIMESDLLSYPTNLLIVYKFRKLTGLDFSGWKIKFYKDLSENFMDPWLIELYEKVNGYHYNNSGPGFVLYKGYEKMIILESKDLNTNDLNILPTETLKNIIPEKTKFDDWFEYTTSEENYVTAWFEIDVNEKGKKVLKAHQLPSKFPAIIDDSVKNFTYFCGDFSKSPDLKFKTTFYYPILNYTINKLQENNK